MARFTASFTVTEATDWEAGDFLRFDKFRDQVGQNLEYLLQTHNHDGGSGDGGTLAVADPKALWFFNPPAGVPFA